MARWDIFDRDRTQEADARRKLEDFRKAPEEATPAPRRGASDDSLEPARERPAAEVSQTPERRTHYKDHGRTYSLRNSEIETMTDIGKFRVLDVQDLARFVYRGDASRMNHDLVNLRAQGLLEEKRVFRAHKESRRLATLTEQGYRLIAKNGDLPNQQRIYHGFVKLRELDHDVDLYKVYQNAVKPIQQRGGKPLRVRLDFELKETINREKEAARHLSQEQRAARLRIVAAEHGLTLQDSRIHLPDIQVEYETRDGRIERENIELLSRNYREEGIRSKASAGFSVYARSGDTNRIRRALRDTGIVREVLSI